MASTASCLSPTTLLEKSVLELSCPPADVMIDQPAQSRESMIDLGKPHSPIDLELNHSPYDTKAQRHSLSGHDPKPQLVSSHLSNSSTATCLTSLVKISHSPTPVTGILAEPVGALGSTSPEVAHILFPTPSTSSGHDSSSISPRALETSYEPVPTSLDSDIPDPSSVRRRGRKPKTQDKQTKKSPSPDVQLILDLREVTAQAVKTFEVLDKNWYQYKNLGKTKAPEDSMICDCSWSPGQSLSSQSGDDADVACTQESGCINMLTQVECLEDECRCRKMCQNQRFQKRQYAPIEIVLTEKKGFGVRLREDVKAETFVYEYVGEVVGEKAFQKRIKEYAEEGLKHFYFMQLQREEYIDATKKGGLGRFLNHSCNPNCQIGKWVVGRQVRMGIFTKRAVKAGEELTFNYNVDRYGYDAQECYCGEPNCVGFLGGKTQTDVGAMDELYIDALGISADVEALALKGSKTKRGKKMDVDYMPIMRAIPLKDVPKVASAIRQSISNKRILSKLLRRISITDEPAVQKQLMRLHGFSMMSMVLNEYLEDQEIVKTTLEILLKWPLLTKNKLVSTNIEDTVMKLSSSPSETIQTLAAELVDMWVDLSVSYRIPKAKEADETEGGKRKSDNLLDKLFSKRVRRRQSCHDLPRLQLVSETQYIRPEAAKPIKPEDRKPEDIRLPLNWSFERTPDNRVYFYHIFTRQTQWSLPTPEEVAREEKELADFYARQKAAAMDVDDIVAKAKADAEANRKEEEARHALEEAEQKKLLVSDPRRKTKHTHRHHSGKTALGDKSRGQSSGSTSGLNGSEASRNKDKKMMRLFSSVVVRTMSRYKDSFEHDQFKKRAKELTDILCQKESKSSNYQIDNYDKLTPEKEVKIKSFVKDWVAKLLARKGISTSASGSASKVAELHCQKPAQHPKAHDHSTPSIPDLSPQTPAAAPTSHVPYTPVTPGSKSISDLSNGGDLDTNLHREINGAHNTSTLGSTARAKPPTGPETSRTTSYDAQSTNLPPESHPTFASFATSDQLPSNVSEICLPLDLAPPPPPPPPSSCQVDESRVTSSTNEANQRTDVIQDCHLARVQLGLSNLCSDQFSILPSALLSENISQKSIDESCQSRPSETLLCLDRKAFSATSSVSLPHSTSPDSG
ncbi:hypothetical protein CROQUDRAFT_44884 [Cronartium quercuum f. sp. fusiforme G11]|uniref:Histone-lysine N-methyltransferase, H3 lysine-36 specific n=1 Tax=Cronartium quercuum f. sp. fusiforme G11 TaxID=708437 RepID=A0A9P6NL08_9BASI|nr:hypothetical protein CROQUDRAFT_44884 [Cronartium quercuum f. sp. fusiforme G11]